MTQRLTIHLPDGVEGNMPQQYVSYLADPERAEIVHSAPVEDRVVEIERDAATLVWKYRDDALRMAADYVFGAAVLIGSHGPSSFISFCLIFGLTERDGQSMLTGPLEMREWFREVAEKLDPVIPGGVKYCLT